MSVKHGCSCNAGSEINVHVCKVPRPQLAQRLIAAWRLVPIVPNLHPVYKRGRYLFEGGFYTRKYGKHEYFQAFSRVHLIVIMYLQLLSYCNPIYIFSCTIRTFKQLSELMSEKGNWMVYCRDLEQQLTANIPCIPFLGVFLTQIVQQDSYNQCKPKTGDVIRKRLSGLENYTILETITVRNQLEKLTHQHLVPCITNRGVDHRETDGSEPTSEADDTLSPLAPAQSTIRQSVQPSEQHLEEERQQASLQNSERVCSPLQLSQSTVVAVSPRRTNRTRHCSLIRKKSLSDHALDVIDLGTESNNIDFADDNYVHSQNLKCLQDNELSSIDSSPFSGDSPDSPNSIEEQTPTFKFPPRFKTTMSLPNGGLLSPNSWAASTCNRKRRATEVVLRPKVVRMNCSTSPSDLLMKYQLFSLGCCRGMESRAKVRALLTSTAHNTEGQNYKLSFQTEPQ